jgi:hypothetical protein
MLSRRAHARCDLKGCSILSCVLCRWQTYTGLATSDSRSVSDSTNVSFVLCRWQTCTGRATSVRGAVRAGSCCAVTWARAAPATATTSRPSATVHGTLHLVRIGGGGGDMDVVVVDDDDDDDDDVDDDDDD